MARRARLDNLTVDQLENLLAAKRREAKLAPLERTRASLLKKLRKVEAKIAKLTEATPARTGRPRKKKGGMSAKGREAISRAQKARWAKIKGAQTPPAKRKRRYSAEARARMAAGSRARWAKEKAGKKATMRRPIRRAAKASAAPQAVAASAETPT